LFTQSVLPTVRAVRHGAQPVLEADQDLALADALADAAAAVTLARFGDRLPTERKDDDTPVTEVDRTAERAMRAVLAERVPDDAILGEEHGSTDGLNGRRWVLDPVDGTKLYAEGIPLWTTLIALEVDGTPVLGVADAPALGARYRAVRGGGAWRDDRPLSVSAVDALDGSLLAHSPIDEWLATDDAERLLRIAGRARATRGLSDAWAQLLVAQGSMEVLLEHEPCYAWDWSATRVIVEEAGGRMTTLEGGEPSAGSNLLVSNGRVHDEVVAALTERGT
jgi:histidinol-phosphatase